MKYVNRPAQVDAHRYDGSNRADLELLLELHCGEAVRLDSPWLIVGTYLVLYPDSGWELSLPSVFEANWQLVPPPPPDVRSCFTCVNYTLDAGAGRCGLFNETIHSEIYSAADCLAYDPNHSL